MPHNIMKTRSVRFSFAKSEKKRSRWPWKWWWANTNNIVCWISKQTITERKIARSIKRPFKGHSRQKEVIKTVNRKNASVHNFPNSKTNVKVGLKTTRMMTALIVKTRPYAFTRILTFLETQKTLETLKC